jgi:RNA polymerase sigma factor (sigma-70 family)
MEDRSEKISIPESEAAWLKGFEDLSRRLRQPLLRFFQKKVGSYAVAEELVQDLFLRLLRKPDLFTFDNVNGYIFEAAMNLIRDRARKSEVRAESLHVDIEGLELQSNEPSAERVFAGRQKLDRLMTAIEKMPFRTRSILILNRFEGMTYAQIAEKMGITVSAVEKHIMKALMHLSAED